MCWIIIAVLCQKGKGVGLSEYLMSRMGSILLVGFFAWDVIYECFAQIFLVLSFETFSFV
jgi:preprotein translocase subunit SecG